MSDTKSRDISIDALKFWLIVLVVLGHMLGVAKLDDVCCYSLYNIIYAFHMPLFIFISGYFTTSKDIKKSFKFIETFLVFQLILLLPQVYTHNLNLRQIISPQGAAWYLFSLFIWRFLYCILPNINLYILLFISIVASLGIGFIDVSSEFALQKTCAFSPFFVLGLIVREKNAYLKLKNWMSMKMSIIIFLIFVILMNFVSIKDSNFSIYRYLQCYYPYSTFPVNEWLSVCIRLLQLFISAFVSLAFIKLVSIIPISKGMIEQGKNTLYIYIYHWLMWWVIYFCYLKFLGPYYNIISALFSTFIVLVLIFYMERFSIYKWILNPFSNIYNKKRH